MDKYIATILEELTTTMSTLDSDRLETLTYQIAGKSKVFCCGLGRSGLVMKALAMRLKQMGMDSVVVGETTAPAFGEGDSLIVCTASGASPILKYYTGLAKENGGKVYVITGEQNSSIAELANELLLIPAPNKDDPKNEILSIQPMGTLFEQSAALLCDALILHLMRHTGITGDDMRKSHANIE